VRCLLLTLIVFTFPFYDHRLLLIALFAAYNFNSLSSYVAQLKDFPFTFLQCCCKTFFGRPQFSCPPFLGVSNSTFILIDQTCFHSRCGGLALPGRKRQRPHCHPSQPGSLLITSEFFANLHSGIRLSQRAGERSYFTLILALLQIGRNARPATATTAGRCASWPQ